MVSCLLPHAVHFLLPRATVRWVMGTAGAGILGGILAIITRTTRLRQGCWTCCWSGLQPQVQARSPISRQVCFNSVLAATVRHFPGPGLDPLTNAPPPRTQDERTRYSKGAASSRLAAGMTVRFYGTVPHWLRPQRCSQLIYDRMSSSVVLIRHQQSRPLERRYGKIRTAQEQNNGGQQMLLNVSRWLAVLHVFRRIGV